MKILKFSLPTCKPCITLTEQMKKIDLSNFEIQEINLQREKHLSVKYGIRKVPTLIILDEQDNEIERVGNITQLESFLNKKPTEKVKLDNPCWIDKIINLFKL